MDILSIIWPLSAAAPFLVIAWGMACMNKLDNQQMRELHNSNKRQTLMEQPRTNKVSESG